MSPTHTAKHGQYVGASVRRREDPRFLTGAATYVGDVRLPGMLHAAVLRSPHAHARIVAIDPAAARALRGVRAVLTAKELEGAVGPFSGHLWKVPPSVQEAARPLVRPDRREVLARDVVRFVGEAVAIVAAADRYVAEDALDLIQVTYEPLPVVRDPEGARGAGAPVLHPDWGDNTAIRFGVGSGDVEAAFAGADVVVGEAFRFQRQGMAPMEVRGSVASYEERTGTITLWCSTQVPHAVRDVVAGSLGLPEHRVRVIAPDVGGGFGYKALAYPEEVLVAHLARLLRRPVKWIEDRRESFLGGCHARDQVHVMEAAARRDGTILAIRDRFVMDSGAFNPLALVIPYNTAAHLLGPYRVRSCRIEGETVVSNKTPAAPYRGAGRPQAVFAMDRIVDRVARRLGLDPADVRLRNLVRAEEFPYDVGLYYRDGHRLIYDSGDYAGGMRVALERIGYEAFREEQARLRGRGRYLGIGLACYTEGTAVGPFEGAVVRVDGSGKVLVATGACCQGQGHETTFAQIAADALGVDLDDVTIVEGDTAAIPFGFGTLASRSIVLAGNALALAAAKLKAKALQIAAELLEARAEDLVAEGNRIFVKGAPGRAISWRQVAAAAAPGGIGPAAESPGLEAAHYLRPATVTYAYGANAVTVEVDIETGAVRILKYVLVHDCGRSVNPMIVDAQMEGGTVQGIGSALMEEMVFDGEGQLLTTSLMDYLIPTAADVPGLDQDHLNALSPRNPLGLKGVGEGGAIGPPAAIANAVEDALSPFGVVVTEIPLTPERVLALIRKGVLAS
jgi:carbon-monoxide dehydrogenase large subunit